MVNKEIKDPYGFIYIITNLINGKRYIGQRKFDDKQMWKYYLGSGVALKNAKKKYGSKNFKKEIIYVAYSKQELDKVEIEYIKLFNAIESTDYYNIAPGGEGFCPKQKCHYVYCLELNTGFKNCYVAEKITEEKFGTIRSKCKYFHNGIQNVKNGMHWCFIEDIYKTFGERHSYQSKPVVDLINFNIYANVNHARKASGINYHKRSVISVSKYKELIDYNKSVKNKLIFLNDFLEEYDYTDKYYVESFNKSIKENQLKI